MSKADTSSKETSSWRELDQTVNPRTLSSQGRRRLACGVGQTLLLTAMCAGIGWGIWEITSTLTNDATALSDPVNAAPLREIVLINDADGGLTQEWVERTLNLRKGTPLIELDLFQLRAKLLAGGQVRSADLRRDFPGTLTLTLHERLPILRMRVQAGGAPAQTLLVARDGTVYEGFGYDSARLAALPWLDGVRLARNPRGGYLPVAGMESVADLLQTVQNEAPVLYLDWKVVSLDRLAAYDEIAVKTRSIPEVVFSRRIEFARQIARLDYITDYARLQADGVVQRVDLSLGGNVPVSFENPAPRPPTVLPLKPSNPKIRRDL